MKLVNPFITPHARQRASQRFNVAKHKAIMWTKHKAESAKFVSEIIDDNGKPGRLFVSNGVGLVADLTENIVITVMKPNRHGQTTRKLHRFASKEISLAEREEAKAIRKLTQLQAELEIEIGELRMRLSRARSTPKKLAIQGRMKALKMRLDELPAEVHAIKRERVRKVNALARVM